MHTELQVLPVMQRQRVTVAGKTVIVETEPAAGGKWLLHIVGRREQISEWTQLFHTAGEALNTGLSAIRYEGIDDFHDDPLFDYLHSAAEALSLTPSRSD